MRSNKVKSFAFLSNAPTIVLDFSLRNLYSLMRNQTINAKPAPKTDSVTPSDGGTAFSMDPRLPRERSKDSTELIESASTISCGDIKFSDDWYLLCTLESRSKDRVDDIEFTLGVDNNPLPLAVKAEEKGAAAMASSADRRPSIRMLLVISRVWRRAIEKVVRSNSNAFQWSLLDSVVLWTSFRSPAACWWQWRCVQNPTLCSSTTGRTALNLEVLVIDGHCHVHRK